MGAAARAAGEEVALVDLSLADDPAATLDAHLADRSPELVAMTFRNVDDCFWPSAQWFVGDLARLVADVRARTDAPVVLGGVGFSIFAERIVPHVGADFGIRGDGEAALLHLLAELRGRRRLDRVPGLVWRTDGQWRANECAMADNVSIPTARDLLDNAAYFRMGGQGGVETKRGCGRQCLYCPEPTVKGRRARVRRPSEVADEFASLADQGVDVLHLCDSEFNLPADHAGAVCDELIRRGLGERVRWYAYLAVVPFDADLADRMRRAGCAGINFTADATCPAMLRVYRQPHRREQIDQAVRLCRRHGIAVMLDLLLGGPGETPETARETIEGIREIGPDCAGASLGIRVYPHTAMAEAVLAEGLLDTNPAIRRKYGGPVDFFRPTFYISREMGPRPAALVHELIGENGRFFPPALGGDDVRGAAEGDHNYNDNAALAGAIAAGARGAYWDILRTM